MIEKTFGLGDVMRIPGLFVPIRESGRDFDRCYVLSVPYVFGEVATIFGHQDGRVERFDPAKWSEKARFRRARRHEGLTIMGG